MNPSPLLIICCIAVICFSSCAKSYRGTLVDARSYLNLKSDGHSQAQKYAAFYAMKGNLPAGILMKNDKIIFLCNPSLQLASYSSLEVKAKGKYISKFNLLKADQLWVKTDKGWEIVPLH